MPQTEKSDTLHVLAKSLAQVTREYFYKKGGVKLPREPVILRREIIEFKDKMRLFDLEKFETPTFISIVYYFADEKGLAEHQVLGFLIIFLEQEYVPYLLKALKYPEIDWDDEEAMRDACGTLCNVMAGQFKTEIAAISQIDLEMSHFSFYDHRSIAGVDFHPGQREKYEISFFIDGKNRVVLEMSMGPLPLRL